nr:translation initiation factor IF-2-like isoform X1 [Manis javanica]XP_036874535.1 translation initiation factor IF-2-like isoform X1 [Manis javanica]
MNSAGEARRARARGRCRPAGCPSPLANQRGPPGHPIPTAGTAPAHARIRPHRAAGGRPHILELDSAPPTPTSSARTRFLRAAPPRQRPAAPAPPRPARGRPGPFRTPGPRLPAAWRSHRHSPWVPRAHCTQAADGMDAGRGGTGATQSPGKTGALLKLWIQPGLRPCSRIYTDIKGKVTGTGGRSPPLA